MAAKFMQLVLTPAVQAARERYFGKHQAVAPLKVRIAELEARLAAR